MRNVGCSRIWYTSVFILLLIIFVPPLSAGDLPVKLPDAPKLEAPKAPKIKVPDLGLKKKEDVIVITEMQDAYDAISEITPAVCMLGVSATSAVPDSMQQNLSDQLNRFMTLSGMFKPVSMEKWLVSKYGINKCKNIFTLMNDLKAERYPVMLDGICKPYLFKDGEWYVMYIELMPFKLNGYPLMALRIFKKPEQIPEMVTACINDLGVLYSTGSWQKGKKRIAVAPFDVECRKMVGLKSGEFEYITTSFTEQDGVTFRDTDDFFSRLFSYVFTTTGMFSGCPVGAVPEYAGTGNIDSSTADYLLRGRVQLTDEVNIYYVDFINLRTNTKIRSAKFFTSDFSLSGTWKLMHDVLTVFCGDTLGKDSFGIIPTITSPSQGFYIDNMFAGWDTLGEVPLSRGKHRIRAGTYVEPYPEQAEMTDSVETKNSENNIRNYFVYVDTRTWLFKGKDGEYVWNLLEK
jgi:hypothetical protein